MTKQQMKQIVLESLVNYLPCDKHWEIRETVMEKDNDDHVDAISVSCDDKIAKVFRVDILCDQYYQGTTIACILKNIVKQLLVDMPQCVSMTAKNIIDFQMIKDNIFAYIINTKMNQSRLTDMPHRNLEDLSIVYRVLMDSDEESNATIAIGKELMTMWDIDEETLYEVAIKNTKKLFPANVQGMNNVIKDMLDLTNQPSVDWQNDYEMENMFVISNNHGIRGAIYMFDAKTLTQIANQLDVDQLYIFPSSIHEVIACAINCISREEANSMVAEINSTIVHKEDVLSNHAYLFNKNTMTVTSL